MRQLAFGLALILGVGALSTSVLGGAPPTGTVTPGPNRTFTVCVNDPDDPPGTTEIIELHVDGLLYDGFTLTDGSCTTRGYAPFGPPSHPVKIFARDLQGLSSELYSAVLTETCSVFPTGSSVWGWCGDPNGQTYYATRQKGADQLANTFPLISENVWAGVTKNFGGAIQQLYSSDRSFNLLNEHPGAAIQLSLWGAFSAPAAPTSNFCNWVPGPGEQNQMNTIQTQGPNCTWGRVVDDSLYWGPTTGATTYVHTMFNHRRNWTMPKFHAWTWTYIRSDHVELNYRFINEGDGATGQAWNFYAGPQEIPAIHLAEGMNDHFYWGTDGGGYADFAPHGAPVKGTLYKVGVAAPPNPAVAGAIAPWSGSWLTACDAVNHCVTVAPHDQPNVGGIHRANVSSVTPANQITMLGEFDVPLGTDKSIRLYIFPYPIWAAPGGVPIMTRLQQLRGWV